MHGSSFEIDIKALALMLLSSIFLFLGWRWHKGFVKPHILFSDLASFPANRGRSPWAVWPQRLFWTALATLALAFIDPHILSPRKLEHAALASRSTEGTAIYMVLDQSGSMNSEVTVQTSQGYESLTKIDLLKKVVKQFIAGDTSAGLIGRPNDMIGLVFFARAAKVMSPLTLDHETILKELSSFKVVGNRDNDGTSIGYAIYKTANMIALLKKYAQEEGEANPYTIKNSVIILITDGLQDPNPLDKGKRFRNIDVPEAAAYAKEQGVHLYIINVEPKLATEEFTPYRHIMQRAAESTGGRFYMIGVDGSSLEKIYSDIDKLEKSKLSMPPSSLDKDQRPDLYQRLSFYPYLIAFSLLCLLAAFFLDTIVLRKVP